MFQAKFCNNKNSKIESHLEFLSPSGDLEAKLVRDMFVLGHNNLNCVGILPELF